jgi:hypothetical protein
LSITSQALLKPFLQSNSTVPYAEQVKPCGFLISGHVAHYGHPAGTNPKHFHVVQPYSRDVSRWREGEWIDIYSGNRYHSTTRKVRDPRGVILRTFGDVIEEYAVHPESKSNAANGEPCGPLSKGLLKRRSVVARSTGVHVGKEANRVEEVELGLIHNISDVQAVFVDPERDPVFTTLLPALKSIPLKTIADRIGRSERQARSYRNGHVRPPAEVLPFLWDLVREERHPTQRKSVLKKRALRKRIKRTTRSIRKGRSKSSATAKAALLKAVSARAKRPRKKAKKRPARRKTTRTKERR